MLTVGKGLRRPNDEAAAQRAQRFREEVGRRIESAMNAAGLNHRSLAEKAGIDRSLITRLINGERRANGDQLVKLSGALGVHAATLMPGSHDVVTNVASGSGLTTLPSEGHVAQTTEGQQVAEIVDALLEKEHRLEALRRVLNYVSELRDPHAPAAEVQGPRRGRAE